MVSLQHTLPMAERGPVFRAAYGWLDRSRPGRALLRARDPEVTVTWAGLRLALRPGGNYSEHLLYLTGAPAEPASLEAVQDRLRGQAGLFVDIGANFGLYSLGAAQAMGPGGRVLAFEPNPVMAARMRANLARNGLSVRVDLIEAAVAAASGRAVLHAHPTNAGQCSLRAGPEQGQERDVPAVTLLEALAGQDLPRPFLLKADIEGYEDGALMPFFTQAPEAMLPDAALIELEHRHLWRQDLSAALAARGYHLAYEGEGNGLFVRSNGEALQ